MLGHVDRNVGAFARWFSFIFNPNQTLLEKVTKMTTHIFIPGLVCLGIYAAVRRYYSYESQPKLEVKPYPRVCKDALEFARGDLQKRPDIQPIKFTTIERGPDTYQPINPEIAKLQALYDERYMQIEGILMDSFEKSDPWEDKEFLMKVDEAMSIAYAISCLTLDDLPEFQKKLKEQGVERTFAECLTQQDSYQYRTFYECTWLYHVARAKYRPVFNDFLKTTKLSSSNPIPLEWAENFYNDPIKRSVWRELYNDFCHRVRMYVTEEELERADSRHVKWTQKDMGKEDLFHGYPTMLPT